jgi:hypothetical protein
MEDSDQEYPYDTLISEKIAASYNNLDVLDNINEQTPKNENPTTSTLGTNIIFNIFWDQSFIKSLTY